jgi:urea carboxylase-associated protein 2
MSEARQARIDALRARYEALRAEGQSLGTFDAHVGAAARSPRTIARDRVRLEAELPAGWYWQGRVPAGTCLRLHNLHGTPGVACLLWNAADPSERFCATDTVKVQWTSRIGRGRLLLSDMGRVLASIVDDTCGRHDTLLGAGPPRAPDDRSSPLEERNAWENLALAAAKLGLGPRDLHAPITFFAPVRCADQRFGWEPEVPLADTFVDLHAEMDLLVAVSNVPHPLAPAGVAGQSVKLSLWQPESKYVSTFCRAATAEAQRAFERTRAYLDGRG